MIERGSGNVFADLILRRTAPEGHEPSDLPHSLARQPKSEHPERQRHGKPLHLRPAPAIARLF